MLLYAINILPQKLKPEKKINTYTLVNKCIVMHTLKWIIALI